MRPLVLLLAVLFPLASPAQAPMVPRTQADADLLFREANDAFLTDDFDGASRVYRAIVVGGFGTADVHYNLGNADFHAGRLGEATLGYERALRAEPSHADARANLRVVRKRNVDKLVGASDGPVFFERLGRAVAPAPVTWAFLGAWLLLFTSVLFRRVGIGGRGWTGLLAGVSLVLSLGLGALLGTVVWYREKVVQAVVTGKVVQVRKGPAPKFEVAFEVHEGLTVRTLEIDGPYQRVRLDNGLEGWLLRSRVQQI